MSEVNPKLIRQVSLDTAVQLGYPTNAVLPLSDVPSLCRSQSEIIDRILGMHCLAACAYGFDREKAQAWYEREIRHDALTATETHFLRTGDGNKEQFMVQIEGMWALAWAVRLVDALDFGQACSPRLVAMLPDLKSGQSAADVRSKASIRPLGELVAANDLAYCLHWAIRQAEFDRATLPGKIGPHVVVERRRALEWVLSSAAWDDVPLDT